MNELLDPTYLDLDRYDMGNVGQWPGINGFGDHRYRSWARCARESERKFKALTRGSGITQSGSTGGLALGVQYTSFRMEDCVLMKRLNMQQAYGPTVEWTEEDYPGAGGDGFTDETGSDGLFGADYSDDTFKRNTETIKYMAEARQVSLVLQESRIVANKDPIWFTTLLSSQDFFRVTQ